MDIWLQLVQYTQMALEEAMDMSPVLDSNLLRRVTNMGEWLIVLLSMVNGTELGSQEWRDSIFLRYTIYIPELPPHCDGLNSNIYLSCPGL